MAEFIFVYRFPENYITAQRHCVGRDGRGVASSA